MSKEDRIKQLLVAMKDPKKNAPTREIAEDMKLIAKIAGEIGTQADKSTALMRLINIEFVETALNNLLVHATTKHIKPAELKLVVNFLVKVQQVFNENLKNYHEHDATLRSRLGKLGEQLGSTIQGLQGKNIKPAKPKARTSPKRML